MTANVNNNFGRALGKLEELGLLLVSGNEIPDLRRLVGGHTSKGSWWADPAAHQIFAINAQLEDHPDVVITRLVSRKVTFVHRTLWNRMFAVATARDDWQLEGLSTAAKKLLEAIDKEECIRTDKLNSHGKTKPGDLARELELRLLIHSDQVHTELGKHAKLVETWNAWAKRINFKPRALETLSARKFLENRIEQINKEYSGCGKLPWQ